MLPRIEEACKIFRRGPQCRGGCREAEFPSTKFGLHGMRYDATAVATGGAGFLDDFGQAHRQQNHSTRDEALVPYDNRVQWTCESGLRDNDGSNRGVEGAEARDLVGG